MNKDIQTNKRNFNLKQLDEEIVQCFNVLLPKIDLEVVDYSLALKRLNRNKNKGNGIKNGLSFMAQPIETGKLENRSGKFISFLNESKEDLIVYKNKNINQFVESLLSVGVKCPKLSKIIKGFHDKDVKRIITSYVAGFQFNAFTEIMSIRKQLKMRTRMIQKGSYHPKVPVKTSTKNKKPVANKVGKKTEAIKMLPKKINTRNTTALNKTNDCAKIKNNQTAASKIKISRVDRNLKQVKNNPKVSLLKKEARKTNTNLKILSKIKSAPTINLKKKSNNLNTSHLGEKFKATKNGNKKVGWKVKSAPVISVSEKSSNLVEKIDREKMKNELTSNMKLITDAINKIVKSDLLKKDTSNNVKHNITAKNKKINLNERKQTYFTRLVDSILKKPSEVYISQKLQTNKNLSTSNSTINQKLFTNKKFSSENINDKCGLNSSLQNKKPNVMFVASANGTVKKVYSVSQEKRNFTIRGKPRGNLRI